MVRAHPSWAAVYRRVLVAFGVLVDEVRLGAALDQTFGEGADQTEGPFEASAEASYQRLKAFDARVLAALGEPPQPDDFFRALEAAFALRSAWWVFEDVPPALRPAARCRFPAGCHQQLELEWCGAVAHARAGAALRAAGHQRPGRLPQATRRHLRARSGPGRRRGHAGRACRGLGSRRRGRRVERRHPAGPCRAAHARACRARGWRRRRGRQRRHVRRQRPGRGSHRCRSSATSTACSTSSTCLAPSASQRPEPPPQTTARRPMPPSEAPDWRLFVALPLPVPAAAAVGRAAAAVRDRVPQGTLVARWVAPRHAAVPGCHATRGRGRHRVERRPPGIGQGRTQPGCRLTWPPDTAPAARAAGTGWHG